MKRPFFADREGEKESITYPLSSVQYNNLLMPENNSSVIKMPVGFTCLLTGMFMHIYDIKNNEINADTLSKIMLSEAFEVRRAGMPCFTKYTFEDCEISDLGKYGAKLLVNFEAPYFIDEAVSAILRSEGIVFSGKFIVRNLLVKAKIMHPIAASDIPVYQYFNHM